MYTNFNYREYISTVFFFLSSILREDFTTMILSPSVFNIPGYFNTRMFSLFELNYHIYFTNMIISLF